MDIQKSKNTEFGLQDNLLVRIKLRLQFSGWLLTFDMETGQLK